MASSGLIHLRDQIVAVWELLIPEDGGRRFRYLGKSGNKAVQTIDHRSFSFDPPSGVEYHQHSSAALVFDWSFNARVFLSLAGLSVDAQFSTPANDLKALILAVNTQAEASWPSSVTFVWADAGRTEEVDSGLELVIPIRAQVWES